jgi:hypothetical protein
MAVVADVHTDTNSRQCLEEGVGYPLEIFVIVNEGGHIRLTRGAMFSYYEFTQPIANRLTDEAWRELLTGDSPPPMPEWVASLMDTKAPAPSFVPDSPASLYNKEFTAVESRKDDQIPMFKSAEIVPGIFKCIWCARENQTTMVCFLWRKRLRFYHRTRPCFCLVKRRDVPWLT